MDGGFRENLQRLIASLTGHDKPSIEEAEAQLRAPEAPVYRDVPILHTAAQMANYTPPKIREMRSIARDYDVYHQAASMIFYTQAKFMEDFEDDYPRQVSFYQYLPTYQSMNTEQLRAYFTWRTRIRRGEFVEAPRAMALVYIYELLNGVGVPSAAAGYEALHAFGDGYLPLDPELERHLRRWMRDYAVYHGLPLDESPNPRDAAICAARHPAEVTPAQLCDALSRLSSYRLETSRFYRQHPEDVAQVVYQVYTALWDYYDNHRKNGIFEKLIGRFSTSRYWMFQGAVFYVQSVHPDVNCEVSETLRYSCRSGSWTETALQLHRAASPELGGLLKEIDCQMRQASGFGYPLQPGKCSKIFQSAVQKAVDAWAKEAAQRRMEAAAEAARQAEQARREEAARRAIRIDVSQLDAIRRAAQETQNRLIVDEEPEEALPAPVPAPVPAPAPEPEPIPSAAAETLPLDAPQLRLLRCLLTGEAYDGWLRAEGLLLSVLVDGINDQLYDRFADTVLLWDGDCPAVIEDYLDELKGLVLT